MSFAAINTVCQRSQDEDAAARHPRPSHSTETRQRLCAGAPPYYLLPSLGSPGRAHILESRGEQCLALYLARRPVDSTNAQGDEEEEEDGLSVFVLSRYRSANKYGAYTSCSL